MRVIDHWPWLILRPKRLTMNPRDGLRAADGPTPILILRRMYGLLLPRMHGRKPLRSPSPTPKRPNPAPTKGLRQCHLQLVLSLDHAGHVVWTVVLGLQELHVLWELLRQAAEVWRKGPAAGITTHEDPAGLQDQERLGTVSKQVDKDLSDELQHDPNCHNDVHV